MKTKHPIVVEFEEGRITAQEALNSLGSILQIATKAKRGSEVRHHLAAIDTILGMPQEPQKDPSADPKWAEAYKNKSQ